MPKSITAVLLDKYPENPSKPLEFFKNHADHMSRSDGPTVKPAHKWRLLRCDNRINAADRLKPRDA